MTDKIKIALSASAEFILTESGIIDDYKKVDDARYYLDIDIAEYDGLSFILTEKKEDGDSDGEIDTYHLIDTLLETENIEIDTELYTKDDLVDMLDEWIEDNIDDKVAFLYNHVYYELNDDVIEQAERVMVFDSETEAGQYFVDNGFFGQVNDKLKYYIDYEKIANDIDGLIKFRNRYYYFNE